MGLGKTKIYYDDLPEDARQLLGDIEIPDRPADECISELRGFVKSYPGYVPGRLNLACFLLESGDVSGARATYEEVGRDFPDEMGPVGGLATVYAAERDFEKAEAFANEAVAGGYRWPPCYVIIAQEKEKRGDSVGAAAAYLEGYRISPHGWKGLEHYCRLTGRDFIPPTEDIDPCISLEQVEELADYIEDEANREDSSGNIGGCDHTFRFTEQWAKKNKVDIIELYQFLNAYGGFCDCEVCYNVTMLLEDD